MGHLNLAGMPPEWTHFSHKDCVLHSSSKIVTLKSTRMYRIMHVRLEYSASRSRGKRRPTIRYADPGGAIVAEARASSSLNKSDEHIYEFNIASAAAVKNGGDAHTGDPLPDIIVPGTYSINILDETSSDVGQDNMMVLVTGLQRHV